MRDLFDDTQQVLIVKLAACAVDERIRGGFRQRDLRSIEATRELFHAPIVPGASDIPAGLKSLSDRHIPVDKARHGRACGGQDAAAST